MDKDSTRITIVGGGDNGLLTALSIRQCNPKMEIRVVDDFSQDPPDFGKSTFQRIILLLHGFLGIEMPEFVTEVKPIWKASFYFRDWCGYEPFHFPFDNPMKFPSENDPNTLEKYYYHYDTLSDSPDHRTYGEEIFEQQKSPMYYDPSGGGYDLYSQVAYHLNTRRFNQFLRKKCDSRDISLVNDQIMDVELEDDRHVKQLQGKHDTYSADLYIDASGFNRIIKSRLQTDFADFSHPVDTALQTTVDRPLSEIEPATIAETGQHGWFWQIDTFDHRDLGYVFASEFVDTDQAMAEFVTHCDGEVSEDDISTFGFETGYYSEAWEGNCIAIGKAEGFVEPLQAANLTANLESARILSNILSSADGLVDQPHRQMYNSWVKNLFNSVYDFITIHYLYGSGTTDFWQSVTSMDVSQRVEHLIDAFDDFGYAFPVNTFETTTELLDTVVFDPVQFYIIMRNMCGESSLYENNDIHVSDDVKASQEELYDGVSEEVSRYLTIEEVHKGVLESSQFG